MQNTVSNSPNSPNRTFAPGPINWLEPLAFKFNQLRDVSAAAERAGFRIFRLKVLTGGYEAQFQRNQTAGVSQPLTSEARRLKNIKESLWMGGVQG